MWFWRLAVVDGAYRIWSMAGITKGGKVKTGIIDITIRLKLSQDVDIKDVENLVSDLYFDVVSPTEGIEVAEIIDHQPKE